VVSASFHAPIVHGFGAGLTLAGVAWPCEPCEHLAKFTAGTWLVSRDPQRRGLFLIGQVALQQCFKFVDALIATAFVDDGHTDRHEVDCLCVRTFAAVSATAGRSLDGAVGQVTSDLVSLAKTQGMAKFWLIEVDLKAEIADNWLYNSQRKWKSDGTEENYDAQLICRGNDGIRRACN
jgi:hypothetical protein